MADLSRVGKQPDLAAIFRRAREAAGLKQEDVVAAVTSLTQSTYSRFELGQAKLDVTQIFEIKAFLDGRVRTRVSGGVPLAALARIQPYQSATPKPGKLTEEIAKEMEAEFAFKEAAELDRQLDEELPALREKVRAQEAEIAALTAQLQEVSAKLKAVSKKRKQIKRKSAD